MKYSEKSSVLKFIATFSIYLLLMFVEMVSASMAPETNNIGPGWYNQTNVVAMDIDTFFSIAGSNAAICVNSTEPPAEIPEKIAELAASLEHDPVRIYEYIHNMIEYVPYFGHLKGAERTLLDRAGNDADQADLLIKLFAASGYSSEFVVGVMSIPYISYDRAACKTKRFGSFYLGVMK